RGRALRLSGPDSLRRLNLVRFALLRLSGWLINRGRSGCWRRGRLAAPEQIVVGVVGMPGEILADGGDRHPSRPVLYDQPGTAEGAGQLPQKRRQRNIEERRIIDI